MGQFFALLIFLPDCLPLFLLTSLILQLTWSKLAVFLIYSTSTSQPWLLLFISSFEVFQRFLRHCCLHEYYRILLCSSNLALSLCLKMLKHLLTLYVHECVWAHACLNPTACMWRALSESVHFFRLVDAKNGTQVNRHLYH